MKKKGFTLVELLAVIAILAILVIIALPNVMSLFNEAKKNSFANELKEIYKTAQNQWMTDSMVETKEINYARENISCGAGGAPKQLQLSGRAEIKYAITVNKAGDVVDYVATDGTYMYSYKAAASDSLKIENIGNGSEGKNEIVRLSDEGNTKATISCSETENVYTITPSP